jgi:hypothetical protein
MDDLHLTSTHDEFVLHGLHRFWALRGSVRVPLDRIRDVRFDPAEVKALRTEGGWLRVPGTYLPGLLKAGTYQRPGRLEFWDVRRPDHAIIVDLEGAEFDRLVVEVADPNVEVARLKAAMSSGDIAN